MKKLFLALTIVAMFAFASCSVNTSDNINIDTDDITYVKDTRTGLCYGIIASRKAMSTDATGLGVTCVPCEAVEKYLED